jgi:hypothetical protein
MVNMYSKKGRKRISTIIILILVAAMVLSVVLPALM